MMNPPVRILVIKLSSFGDIFHALPAVNNLKLSLGAEIDWVTQPEYVELVGCFPVVSRVIAFPRRSFWRRGPAFATALRAERYDYIVDLQGLLKSALVARLARGNRRIGPSFHREGAGCFYDEVAGARNKERHAVEENLDIVRHLGLPLVPVAFPVTFPPVAVEARHPRIAIIPLSRRENKNWPLSHFAEAARQLRAIDNTSIFLFGSSDDHAACERIRSDLMSSPGRDVINLAGKTRLVEMGGWFREMDLVIVNDSGPLHMAAALGVPVVTLFGPTDPRRTGPYGEGHAVCTSGVACRPCFAKVCRQPSLACMDQISVSAVVEAARRVLNRNS